MEFDYTLIETGLPHRPYVHRPLLNVVLKGPNKSYSFLALIDSGADSCVFNYEVGDALGFHPDQQGRREDTVGIEGRPIETWHLTVGIFVPAFNKTFNTEVGFIKSPTPVLLLGQRGFFDHFKVTFERSKVYCTPKVKTLFGDWRLSVHAA